MEEDTRPYHIDHPLYRCQQVHTSEARTKLTTIATENIPSKASVDDDYDDTSSAFRSSHRSALSTIQPPSVRSKMGHEIPVVDPHRVLDDLQNSILGISATLENLRKNLATTKQGRKPTTKQGQQAFGMVEWDSPSSNSSSDSEAPPCAEQLSEEENEEPQEHLPWVEETQRLLRDYQRRFHRQSLTEQAKQLLDRATLLARGEEVQHATNPPNGHLTHALEVCTEALGLCTLAIRDQEEALNRTETVGGSYLVTGDIRLRKRGESLAARIRCLRASVRYQLGALAESLHDCEAALAIWNEHDESDCGRTSHVPSRLRRFACHKYLLRTPALSPLARHSRHPRRKVSHKHHLCLLKGRILAAMGRYREAVVWLTNPHAYPSQTLERSSGAHLESEAAMHQFLEKMQTSRTNHGKLRTKGSCSDIESDQPHTSTTIRTSKTSPATIPDRDLESNEKLWPNLLHSVDRRLNEGMAGKFRARRSSSPITTNGNSGSAIYQMLRHRPFLFHHRNYQDHHGLEDREEADEIL